MAFRILMASSLAVSATAAPALGPAADDVQKIDPAEVASKSQLFLNKPPPHTLTMPGNPSTLITVVGSAEQVPPSHKLQSQAPMTAAASLAERLNTAPPGLQIDPWGHTIRPYHHEEIIEELTNQSTMPNGEVVAFWNVGWQAPHIPLDPTPLLGEQQSALDSIATQMAANVGGYESVPPVSQITWDAATLSPAQSANMADLQASLAVVNEDIATRPRPVDTDPWEHGLGYTFVRTTWEEWHTLSDKGPGAYMVEEVAIVEHGQQNHWPPQTLTLPNVVYVNRPTESGRFVNEFIPSSILRPGPAKPAPTTSLVARAAPAAATGAVFQGENGQIHASAKAGSIAERIVMPTAISTASAAATAVPLLPDHIIAHPDEHDCFAHISGVVGVLCNDRETTIPAVSTVTATTSPLVYYVPTQTAQAAPAVTGAYLWQGPEGQVHGPQSPYYEINTSVLRED